MGYIFEELIRRFNEASNEEAGDHFTPREVICLMVNLIFAPDSDTLTTRGIVKLLYDPACGTGGMLSVSEEYLRELNPDARLEVFGQDYNDQAYAICGSDMMIKGQSLDNIRFGDGSNGKPDHIADITRLYGEFREGKHVKIFDNSDFGYRRITVERPLKLNFAVTEERPARVREASAFVSLATSKKRKDTKAAEAEIAEGKIMQEAILKALRKLEPNGIVKNRDEFSEQMKTAFKKSGFAVPAPLFKSILMALAERDETADICVDSKGNPEPDPELRDYENVPLKEDINEYMAREVLPHVPDARVDESKTKIGYEINFNRYFYQYTPPRPLEEIESDLQQIENEIARMLSEVAG